MTIQFIYYYLLTAALLLTLTLFPHFENSRFYVVIFNHKVVQVLVI